MSSSGHTKSVMDKCELRIRTTALIQISDPLCKALSSDLKFKYLCRICIPILDWSIPMIRMNVTASQRLDAMQRWVCRLCYPCARKPGEIDAEYFRRRAQQCRSHCKSAGLWSIRAAKVTLKMHTRLLRADDDNASNRPWAFWLLKWHDEEWLDSQRARRSSGTGTRLGPGHPATRYAESLNFCKQIMTTALPA